jgi:hypothetical protein
LNSSKGERCFLEEADIQDNIDEEEIIEKQEGCEENRRIESLL